MTAGLEELAAAEEVAVELVDQQVDRLVGVLGGDGREHVGAADLDVAFGDEHGASAGGVVFEIDADAIDSRFVPEQAFGLASQGVAQGVGEGEVDTAKKDLRAGVVGTGVSHGEGV